MVKKADQGNLRLTNLTELLNWESITVNKGEKTTKSHERSTN